MCLSVGHTSEPCKNGRTDRDAVEGEYSRGPINGDGGCGRYLPIVGGLAAQVGWLGLRVGGHRALSLHSSSEPGELSQWLRAMILISSWLL